MPVNIKRIGSDYHSVKISGNLSSATAVRKALVNDNFESVKANVPEDSYNLIMEYYSSHKKFITLEDYFQTIKYIIISKGPDKLRSIYDMSEGLENKLYSNIGLHNNINDFILSVKSKRYTYSRIRRILLNILLDFQKHDDDISCMDFYNISVLAADKKGLALLNHFRDSCRYITKKSDYKHREANVQQRIIKELNQRSDLIYYMNSKCGFNPLENAFKNNIRIINR